MICVEVKIPRVNRHESWENITYIVVFYNRKRKRRRITLFWKWKRKDRVFAGWFHLVILIHFLGALKRQQPHYNIRFNYAIDLAYITYVYCVPQLVREIHIYYNVSDFRIRDFPLCFGDSGSWAKGQSPVVFFLINNWLVKRGSLRRLSRNSPPTISVALKITSIRNINLLTRWITWFWALKTKLLVLDDFFFSFFSI